MQTILVFFIIILSFPLTIICQNNEEIELLLNITECIEKKNILNKTITQEVKKLLNNYNPYNIQKVYEFMQNKLPLVSNCTNDLSEVPEDIKRYIIPFDKQLKQYNWKSYLDCVKNHFRRNKALDYFIKLINDKKYYDASLEEIHLLEEGNIVIIQCENRKYDNVNPIMM